jgi:hypothetical protein
MSEYARKTRYSGLSSAYIKNGNFGSDVLNGGVQGAATRTISNILRLVEARGKELRGKVKAY